MYNVNDLLYVLMYKSNFSVNNFFSRVNLCMRNVFHALLHNGL